MLCEVYGWRSGGERSTEGRLSYASQCKGLLDVFNFKYRLNSISEYNTIFIQLTIHFFMTLAE